MDIRKEREAFESAMFKLADGQTKNEINPVNGQYMYGVMEVMWKVWQAAKAQAVPEGFVVIPKEPNYEIIKAITSYILGENQHGVPVGLELNEAEEIYELLVQAVQEPAND